MKTTKPLLCGLLQRLVGLIPALGGSLLPARSAAESPASAVAADARLQSLDGAWQIAADPNDQGRTGQWYDPARFPLAAARAIQVPGNINETWPNPGPLDKASAANLGWYRLEFIPKTAAEPGLRT
jgi:hypothetical protein